MKQRAFEQAAQQVARYAGDERLLPLLTRGQGLKAGALVFVGAQKAMFRPWPAEPAARARQKVKGTNAPTAAAGAKRRRAPPTR